MRSGTGQTGVAGKKKGSCVCVCVCVCVSLLCAGITLQEDKKVILGHLKQIHQKKN